MFFRMPKIVRRFFRRRMNPMEEREAWSWKTRLSVAYAILAWNGLALVMYQVFKGNKHWPTTAGLTSPEDDEIRPAAFYANLLGVDKAKVVRVSGFHVKTENVDFTKKLPLAPASDETRPQTDSEAV